MLTGHERWNSSSDHRGKVSGRIKQQETDMVIVSSYKVMVAHLSPHTGSLLPMRLNYVWCFIVCLLLDNTLNCGLLVDNVLGFGCQTIQWFMDYVIPCLCKY